MPSVGWLWQIGGEWCTGVSFACLLLGVVLGPAWAQAVMRIAPLRWIGLISYSVYLWHLPLLAELSTLVPDGMPFATLRFVGLTVATVLLLGAASYFSIERPFLRDRRAVASQKPVQQRISNSEESGFAESLEADGR